jgi:hypothetical protein
VEPDAQRDDALAQRRQDAVEQREEPGRVLARLGLVV